MNYCEDPSIRLKGKKIGILIESDFYVTARTGDQANLFARTLINMLGER